MNCHVDFRGSKSLISTGQTGQNEYRAHVKSEHDGKKPFECEFCDITFWKRSTLRYHTDATHDEKKRFSCNLCDFQSYYVKSVDMHKKNVHQKLKPFECLEVWQLYCFHNEMGNLENVCNMNTRKYLLRGYCLAPPGRRKRIRRRENISLSGP